MYYSLFSENQVTPDISIIQLLPKTTAIHFTPGQYLEIYTKHGLTCPFSIANLPNEDGLIELHIRHKNGDITTNEILATLRKDKIIQLHGAAGKNILPPYIHNDVILIAGGTGFSQIHALLQHALTKKIPHHIYLYWGVNAIADLYQDDALKHLQQIHKNFTYTPVLCNAPSSWQYATGLAINVAAAKHPQLNQYLVFASGPYPMITALKQIYLQHNFSLTHLFSDML